VIIGSDYYEHYLQLRVTLLTLKIFHPSVFAVILPNLLAVRR